jgi:hypothetical protein
MTPDELEYREKDTRKYSHPGRVEKTGRTQNGGNKIRETALIIKLRQL